MIIEKKDILLGSGKKKVIKKVKLDKEKSSPISKKKVEKYVFSDYQELENSKLILSYGPQLYEQARYLEGLIFANKDSNLKHINIMKNHDLTPQIRTKLVDWMFEVLYAYKCDESTIYLTMYVMDAFIYKSQVKLTNQDAHFIGVTALYIASKIEDMAPLDLGTIKYKIAHGKFSEKELKKQEIKMLETLEFKVLVSPPNEFIQNFIYDFTYNNKKVIAKLKFNKEIETLEKAAIYISKMILHSDVFSGYKSSIKAISCIILGFDLLWSRVDSLTSEMEKFISEWINFLIEQSRYDPDQLRDLYKEIKIYYENFDSTPSIQHNFKRNENLPF